ncbi:MULTISPECIES: hypothetical protein [Methylobacteriaceae]|uniref:Uncharacterized protein n=4 Tax=Bacteria TaxID=2 RepID=A0ABU9ZL78_9HYPH|nr:MULTISPECIES: hypothetical protein [Methylobacteriaceae]MCX7332290.1 hypothetical protein [Hyphomicrobiales bacterium]MRI57647.1 hypothetical protein [Methylobacterium sp. DB1607]MBI1689938.1 hypothetical protein [Methylorubrum sp. DB1722]MBK3402624.1 hypothetical protein [Methylorubrum rhodesianum]MBY0141452.1 hypothetical protein [Methylorubrum populi]
MIISYQTREQQVLCCKIDEGEATFGAPAAQALVATIADLEAFETAEEMVGFWPGVKISGDKSIEVEIGSYFRATLVPAGVRFERSADGVPNWSTVRYLKLVELVSCP